ncbi:LLM class flavin-dependent oxidoreductase [Pseudoroseicyclus tamaricis]|uniref:LLM class flavin-dependent oxidoreductase n=1 Tax=Pseudoroseicyclus tamaricis TaxID=2705421 RepID=UPI00193FA8FF|nr:LLM class flavin-dependent oxidoreductase [Pseudoroseicyclus tamaricis]
MSIRFDLAGFARDDTLGDHARLMRLAERADVLGYGGIWFNEFHFRGAVNPYPHTLLLGAAILARTERLRFGTSILVLPLHHPLMLAEQVAQLDFQSAGRIDVGVGRGTDPGTFSALGLPPEAKERFGEALSIMLKAWSGAPLSATGPTWQFEDVTVGPPPVQRPHPPVYVAAVSPATMALAVERRLPLLLSLEPSETRQIGPFTAALGGDRAPLRASSLSRYIVIHGDAAVAEEKLQALLALLNKRRADWAAARGEAPPPPRTRTEMLEGHAIAGTPEACAAQIEALTARTGVHSIRLFPSANGALPLAEAERTIELFAQTVLPAFAGRTAPAPRVSQGATS